ncbi:MAG: hypothetical protein V2I56_19735 [Desulfobacteraceae bacterium]|jgi:hypothetical protein|nr:hypothetical protein [Desulfobacteraceae bacterium]
MPQVTLGLSMHRPEMTPIISDHMRRHEAIFLEEPPDAGFKPMLAGRLAVDDYLTQLDVEYPVFSKNMCHLLQELKGQGKQIFQVEPFLKILLGIHEFFAEGHHPEELKKNSIQYPVYLAEKNATRALLAYYQTVMAGSFDDTIDAVIRFARLDAARFGLRDSLRAQEIASMVKNYSSSYVEAGMMHHSLCRVLRQQLPGKVPVKVIFLADDALASLGLKGRLYGPGDQLTLLYIYHPGILDTRREKLLAARSIIYSKIVEKEEMTDNLNRFPHLRDEIDCIRIVKQLSVDDCRRLFPLVRRAQSSAARNVVFEYLAELMPQLETAFRPEKPGRTPGNETTAI